MQILVVLLLFVLSLTSLNAQDLLREASLERQIDNSSLIVEGKVISKKSFWDAENKHIYTANTIQVYKVFKGEPLATIEVITLGGTVGLKAEIVSPSLKLKNGDLGIFTLYNNNRVTMKSSEKSSLKQFMPYGSSQGFYKYNLYDNVAVNPFNVKQGITSSFYNEVMTYTKSSYVELADFDVQSAHLKSTQNKAALAPGSITFTPTTGTAGTKQVLTINGSGFGATKGKVSFRNSDDGGATFIDALSTQILTWADTQITVEIPSEAGTGTIMVTDAGSSSAVSSSVLTIAYAEINVVQEGGNIAYQTQHINANGSGGYTWQMFTDFNNNVNAKAAFLRAFESWRCTTGINWTIGATTDKDEYVRDGTNVIRFDNGNELATDELGRCVYYFSGCDTGTTINWYVEEFDIVFDDATNWNYSIAVNSTGITQYDFESNALHELGHGHQLGHVIDTNDVMNYAISNSEEQRALGASNITAANAIEARSTSINPCPAQGTSVMTNHPCYLSVEEEELKAAINMYPNPTSGQFSIKNTSLVNLEKLVVYDVSGRLISKVDLLNASRTNTINLNGAARGVYFVSIYSDKAMITKKIILE